MYVYFVLDNLYIHIPPEYVYHFILMRSNTKRFPFWEYLAPEKRFIPLFFLPGLFIHSFRVQKYLVITSWQPTATCHV